MSRFPSDDDDTQFDSDAEEPKQLSLMGGVVPNDLPGAEFDPSGDKQQRSLLSSTTLIIVVVAVVAAGSLYAMRVTPSGGGDGAAIDEIEQKIEQMLVKINMPEAMGDDDPLRRENLDALFQETDHIIKMFADDVTKHQVPIDQVAKNPFVLPTFRTVSQEGPKQPVASNDRELAVRKARLEREAGRLKLQTIMSSQKTPVAIINGQIVQPGHEIGEFKVTAIAKMSVTLQAGGFTFVLTMDDKTRTDDSQQIFRN